jgi:hypothetical protein
VRLPASMFRVNEIDSEASERQPLSPICILEEVTGPQSSTASLRCVQTGPPDRALEAQGLIRDLILLGWGRGSQKKEQGD